MPNRWVGSGKTVIRRQSGGLDPSATSLLTSLISWWKLDEASGTRADSVVASGNDLTDNNTVLFGTGKQGNAADFEQANSEWLSRVSGASLQTGDIDFTVCGWVNIESIAGGFDPCLAKKGATASREYQVRLDSATNVFQFLVSSDGSTTTTLDYGSTFTTATWYFVIAWHDSVANTINLQVNNGVVASASYASGITAGAGNFQMSYNDWDTVGIYDGLMDEVAFWKRVLTAAERTYLYNSGAGRTWSAAGIV